MDAISMISCFGEGSVLDTVFLLASVSTAIKAKVANGRHTMGDVIAALLWSIRMCLTGVFDSVDWAGKPYVEGTWEHSMIGQPIMEVG